MNCLLREFREKLSATLQVMGRIQHHTQLSTDLFIYSSTRIGGLTVTMSACITHAPTYVYSFKVYSCYSQPFNRRNPEYPRPQHSCKHSAGRARLYCIQRSYRVVSDHFVRGNKRKDDDLLISNDGIELNPTPVRISLSSSGHQGNNIMPGSQLITTLGLDPVSLSSCEMGSVRLSEVIVSDPDAIPLPLCGSDESPCAADEGSSPPPDMMMMSPSTPVSDLFPCVPVGPCEDNPTFLIFGAFPCDTAPIDPCGDMMASIQCGLTCATCEICEDPEPIMGVDVIFQYQVIDGSNLIIFIDNVEAVSGIQAGVFCETDGKSLPSPLSVCVCSIHTYMYTVDDIGNFI